MPSKKLPDSVAEHRNRAVAPACVALITLSDTRTAQNDQSGDLIQELLEKAGHTVGARRLIADDRVLLSAILGELTRRKEIQAVIMTGGTGIAATDITVETVRDMLDRELPGFNTLFMMLSYPQVGSAAMLSRAIAGVIEGRPVFCLPGSPRACRLAMESLILPELSHMLMLLGT